MPFGAGAAWARGDAVLGSSFFRSIFSSFSFSSTYDDHESCGSGSAFLSAMPAQVLCSACSRAIASRWYASCASMI
jgi:hypothetical protein